MRHFTEDRRKLKELILYVSQRCEEKHDFGLTILNKILYFADNYAFGQLGQPITGADYMRDEHGPVPRHALQARTDLVREGRLRIDPVSTARGHVLQKPVALTAPDVSVFSKDELAVIQDVIASMWNLSTRKIRKRSHDLAAWRAAKMNETIPYEWIFVDDDQTITQAEISHYQALAERHGWLRQSGRS